MKNQYQYKLIRTYPGSLPINTIFYESNGLYGSNGHWISHEDLKNTDFFRRIEICQMVGKFIRKIDLSKNPKIDKSIYQIIGWATEYENSYFVEPIFGKKATSTIPRHSKSWVELYQYYFIDSKGKVQTGFYTSDELMNRNEHSYRKSIGNFFRTKIEASCAIIKITSGITIIPGN